MSRSIVKVLLVTLILLVLGGCGNAERDSLLNERDSIRLELETVRVDLEKRNAELQSLQSELSVRDAELETAKSELAELKSRVALQGQVVARSRALAEVLETVVPVMQRQVVDEAELLALWQTSIEATHDPELQRLADGVISSGGNTDQVARLFVYIFETLPRLLDDGR